jgi:PKD repeat protein
LFVLSIMRVCVRSFVSPAMTVGLTSAVVVVAIAIILFAANITIINAQQLTNQPPAVTQNGTTLFQSTEDSFRLHVPRGWIIHDVNNTGSILSEESTQGYGILAQLCPQEQQAVLPNAASNGSDTFSSSCDQSENNIIHIVRYHDLDTRLQAANNVTSSSNSIMTSDSILSYHLQKLQEVGYRSMQIVNSTDMTVNLTNPQTNQTIAAVPAKFVEMTYNTASAPNEIREGYFILTATNATHPNVGMTKGYSIFYEGTYTASAAVQTSVSTPYGSLPRPLAAAMEVLDSFELIAAPEVAQDMLAAQSEQTQEVVEEPTNPLTVDIISTDTEGGEAIAPATIEFEADLTGGVEPYTIRWDFDDDSSEERSDDDDDVVDHTFEEAGSYDVGLTVTDSAGQSASDSMEVTVEEEAPPVADEEVEVEETEEVQPPVADEEVEEVEDDNNSDSDDLIDVDDVFDVDEFIDDLFGRLGLR